MVGNSKDGPGVVAPPPLIYLGFLLLGLGLDQLWPTAVLPDHARYIAGPALIVLGLAILTAAVRRFGKARTHVQTRKPATAIVTGGPYRVSRNPIYPAFAAIHAGIAVAADSLWVLLLLVPALIVVRYGVIAREERYLEEKFGEDYLRYKARVRRWL